ncbi:MAG: prepilin peptidase [Microthrixaceae bacterium]
MILAVLLTLFGLAVGSFCCVIIDRLPVPLNEPNEFGERFAMAPWREVAGGRSRCSSCGKDVPAHLNVPVFAWLALRGRCRSCGASIGGFHPLVEAVVPLLWLVMAWALGWTWALVPMLWFVPVAVMVGVIDLRTLMVPTKLVWPAAAVSAVLIGASAVADGEPTIATGAALGAVVLGSALFAIWIVRPGGLGFGDVRLAVLIGLHIGALVGTGGKLLVVFSVVLCMGLAAIFGLLIGGVLWALGSRRAAPVGSESSRSKDVERFAAESEPAVATGISSLAVPFGPALLAAALLVAAASPALIDRLGLRGGLTDVVAVGDTAHSGCANATE